MKILILTDSLGLPRSKPEYCSFEDTWPQLISNHHHVHLLSLGGGTITDILRQVEYQKHFEPDVVILQSGIVDCAPRALTRFELDFLKRIPFLGKQLLKVVRKNSKQLRKLRRKTYTNIISYKKALLKLKNEDFKGIPVLGIEIVSPSREYELKIGGIKANVEKYNKVLEDIFNDLLVRTSNLPETGIMSDYIHLTKEGHYILHKEVLKHISRV